jgi:hypothetical protein
MALPIERYNSIITLKKDTVKRSDGRVVNERNARFVRRGLFETRRRS